MLINNNNERETTVADYEWQVEDFISKPTPQQQALALRWTAGFFFLAGIIFGFQGGLYAFVCVALTLAGVAFTAFSKMVERDGLVSTK